MVALLALAIPLPVSVGAIAQMKAIDPPLSVAQNPGFSKKPGFSVSRVQGLGV
jgi:hypothetical protein